MSWWDLPGREGNVIGDAPADIIAAVLRRGAALREEKRQAQPTLPEILGALERALEQTAQEIQNGLRGGERLVAVTSSGEVDSRPGAEDWVPLLSAAISAVAAEYRERFERNSRLVEVLASFAFVMRSDHPALRELQISGPAEGVVQQL